MATESINVEQLLERLGIDKSAMTEDGVSKDAFETAFSKTWISRNAVKDDEDLINPIIQSKTGQRIGSIQTALKSSFKEIGFEIPADKLQDTDGNPVKLETVIKDMMSQVGTSLSDLKNAGDHSDVIQKLEEANDIIKSEKTDLMDRLKETQDQITNMKSEHQTQLNGMQVDLQHKELLKGINFVDTASDLVMAGFNTVLNQSMKRELDENGNIRVTKPDGKAFYNDAKTEELSPKQVYEKLAKDNGILKMNNGDGGGTPPPPPPPATPPENGAEVISDSVAKRIEEHQRNLKEVTGA